METPLLQSHLSPKMYPHKFVQQTTVSIPSHVHQLATAQLLIQVFPTTDASGKGSPNSLLRPYTITIDPVTYDVVVDFRFIELKPHEIWHPVTEAIYMFLQRRPVTRLLARPFFTGPPPQGFQEVWLPPQSGTIIIHAAGPVTIPLPTG